MSSTLALILYPFFSWKILFIFIGGILIDIDHYLLYVHRYKKFNLSDCYSYCTDNDKEHIGELQIFHTIEFLLMFVIFSIYSQLALMFTIGLLAHYIGDIIHRYSIAKSFVSNPSLVSWIIKNKIQKL
mgnify:FL=1